MESGLSIATAEGERAVVEERSEAEDSGTRVGAGERGCVFVFVSVEGALCGC